MTSYSKKKWDREHGKLRSAPAKELKDRKYRQRIVPDKRKVTPRNYQDYEDYED
mgnify:CR=1 FL=1